MLFTWDTTNLCIVFRAWRVTGPATLVLALLGVVALTAGYEAVREASRRYEQRLAAMVEGGPPCHGFRAVGLMDAPADGGERGERGSLLWAGSSARAEEKKGRVVKAALYAVQVFYSFFIMWVLLTPTCFRAGG
ncbi:copper transpport protein [Teratosphaeriaceae sp. CCFEE 6253]|nr:copper transpport protein [Teratosphaeriaceae sp. CCFEE 6253]